MSAPIYFNPSHVCRRTFYLGESRRSSGNTLAPAETATRRQNDGPSTSLQDCLRWKSITSTITITIASTSTGIITAITTISAISTITTPRHRHDVRLVPRTKCCYLDIFFLHTDKRQVTLNYWVKIALRAALAVLQFHSPLYK